MSSVTVSDVHLGFVACLNQEECNGTGDWKPRNAYKIFIGEYKGKYCLGVLGYMVLKQASF